jgi:hypothetical protein
MRLLRSIRFERSYAKAPRMIDCGEQELANIRAMQLWLRCLLISLFMLNVASPAQTPAGFHWVDFRREPNTIARVNGLLQAEIYSAIREIGVVADSALVFTTTREADQNTPEGDMWTVYSISTKSAKVRKLLTGYDLHIVAWLRFLTDHDGELGITYLDCYECEPAKLFTAFHYEPNHGWRTRWTANGPGPPPGYTSHVVGCRRAVYG